MKFIDQVKILKYIIFNIPYSIRHEVKFIHPLRRHNPQQAGLTRVM